MINLAYQGSRALVLRCEITTEPMATVYAFDLPYYPEHHDMDFGYTESAFVAWIPTAFGERIWDVLHGPQPPAVQGPAEALPF